ncbi:MAG: aldo/keto reductase [Acidobacteria bacterium]|nr:aldo/keto reductase [Acidobacteriota bacterium]MBI3281635.1 aldo/keto reductase [Acidobacteriota bacterium]
MDRRTFLSRTAGAGVTSMLAAAPAPKTPGASGEWRNRQPGMAYRRLGRTGMMISEILSGGDPIRTNNYDHLNLAIERGLNYLDMAPAYGRGDCEQAYGKLLGGSAKRGKVFLTTKVSGFTGVRNQLYKEIFDALPAAKQNAIRQLAGEMVRERGVDKPGYFFDYYPGQRNQIGPAYLSNAMAREHAHKVDGSAKFREFMTKSVEDSLKRVGTDHFDLVMCPHGACTPEELDIPEIVETFQRLKKQGKVRFLGVTSHTDPAGILRKATALGHYDAVMMAYNVINGGYLDQAIREAAAKNIGVIGMKVAMAVATHHKQLQPVPQWRIDKVNRIVPGEMKPPMKAYLWALQNPNISAVVSNLWDETFIRENLSLAGKKVELQPA